MSRPAHSGSVYIASPEGHTGKSLVALGVIEVMVRRVGNVGVFRPVVRSIDAEDAMGRRLVSALGDTPAKRLGVGVTYDEVHDDPDAAMSHIIARYRHLAETCDFVVVVGSDYTDVASPAELAFNGSVAANLGAPVLLVVSGFDRTADEVTQVVEMARFELKQSHADVVCAVLNRCAPQALGEIAESVRQLSIPAWALPEAPILSAPLVAEVADALGGSLLFGDPSMLQREASKMLVCAMTTENVLARLEDGQLCIAAGDRSDVLLALAAAHAAPGFPTLAGIVLNGGFRPGDSTEALVRVLDPSPPILLTDPDPY